MVAIVALYLPNHIYNIWLPSNQPQVVNMIINQTSPLEIKKRRELLDKNLKYLAYILTIVQVHVVFSVIP